MSPAPQSPPTPTPIAGVNQGQEPAPRRFPALPLALAGLAICYALPLWRLVRFALESDLFSFILIVPAVTGYLIWPELRPPSSSAARGHRGIAVALAAGGFFALAGHWALALSGRVLSPQDALAPVILSFVLLTTAVCAFFLERGALRRAAFALVFLLFMVPFPTAMEAAIETFLQHGSAPFAHAYFVAAGTTMHYHDLIFELPGISLRVAPECSGIRSTLVLFMTSLVAGHLFLRSPWRRFILTAAVIPLALLRNGFRIFVLGQLCIQIGPHMIDSVWHHQGGPIFFALSLVPFSILVYFLMRGERRARRTSASAAN